MVLFPQGLRSEVLKITSRETPSARVVELLTNNPVIQDQFLAWAQQHKNAVRINPLLSKMYEISRSELIKKTASSLSEERLGRIRGFTLSVGNIASKIFETIRKAQLLHFKAFESYLDQWLAKRISDGDFISNHFPKETVVPVVLDFVASGVMHPSQLGKLLSLLDKDSRSPISKECFQQLCKDLHPDYLAEVLKTIIKSSDISAFKLVPMHTVLLARLPPHLLLEVLKVNLRNDESILFTPAFFPQLFPLIERLPPALIKDVLSIKTSRGFTVLCFPHYYPSIVTLLHKLSAVSQKDLMVIPGANLLSMEEPVFSYSLSLLEQFPPELLREVLCTPVDTGKTMIYDISQRPRLAKLLPFIDKLSQTDFFAFLKTQNIFGNTYLHAFKNLRQGADAIQLNFAWLDRLSKTQLFELVKVKDNEGRIALYECSRELLAYVQRRLPEEYPSLLLMEDNYGLSIEDYKAKKPSRDWLKGPKEITQAPTPLASAAYAHEAKVVTADSATLWEAIPFGSGAGQINPIQFIRNDFTVAQRADPAGAVISAVNEVLETINKKRIWTGTPRPDEPEKVHAFYSEMLPVLKEIIDYLKDKKDPDLTAGYFARIAVPVFEGRCATAYKEELKQILFTINLVEGRVAENFEKFIQTTLNYALSVSISEATRKGYGGDVHIDAQMQHLTGLAPNADHLVTQSAAVLKRAVKKEWQLEAIMKICLPYFRKLNKEELAERLKGQVPLAYKPLDAKYTQAQIFENGKVRELQLQLAEADMGISAGQARDIATFFSSHTGSAMRYHAEQPALQAVISKLSAEERQQVYAADDVQVVWELLMQSALNKLPVEKRAQVTDGGMPAIWEHFQKAELIPANRNTFRTQLLNLVETNKLRSALVKKFEINDPALLQKLMVVKTSFDLALKTYAAEKDIFFQPRLHGLPSRALADARKEEFVSQFFNEEGELNGKGALLLMEYGRAIKPVRAQTSA